MSKNENNLEQQIKQIIQELQDHEGEEKDNSFVFLESKSLHLMIKYLLKQLDIKHINESRVDLNELDLDETLSYIDVLMQEGKKDFEEIIRLITEKK